MKNASPSLVIPLSAGLILFPACGRAARVQPPAAAATPIAIQVGTASWYGKPYHGRQAASGEIYDMESLTAAHQTLSFGTRVHVENLDNGKSVDVRINDRGPFSDDRIIDVSRAAARALGMLESGTARVRIKVLSIGEEAAAEFYAVQVGAFRENASAERLRREMEKRYGTARIVERDGNPVLWRVLVGRTESVAAAGSLARRIGAENRDTVAATLVVRLD